VLKEATIVGIGASVVGFGVADHLAQMGRRDLLVGEGGPLFRKEYARLALASPCSGHGFNFASVVGEFPAKLVADVEAARDTSTFHLYRLTRLPRRSLRRAVHAEETGSTP
jgi:glycine/D-amino acid oxidase-like deaminating enzyme